MTQQAVFNKVARHLLKQNRKSMDNKCMCECMYHSPEGLSCAVGCLISKADYRKEMESWAVRDLVEDLPEFLEHLELLNSLQKTHDIKDVADWRASLEKIAEDYNLKFPKI